MQMVQQAASAGHLRISSRPQKEIRVCGHNNCEIPGNPSTRLAYKRNPLTPQIVQFSDYSQYTHILLTTRFLTLTPESNRGVRPYGCSQHSDSRTLNIRGEHQRGRRSRRSRSMFENPKCTNVFSRIRRDRSESPKHKPGERGRRDGGVFNRLGGKGKSVSAHSESRYQSSRLKRMESVPRKRHHEGTCSRRIEMLSKSENSVGGHWKSKSKNQKSSIEDDDLSQPWVCEETDPFTPRIRYFELPKKIRMLSNVKTYDGSDDPKDHLKKFQAAAKMECWTMPTWCHMFNSTLIKSARIWFDVLLPESIDSYCNIPKPIFKSNVKKSFGLSEVGFDDMLPKLRPLVDAYAVSLAFMAWNVIACLNGLECDSLPHGMESCLHGMNVIACLHDMVDKLAFMAWLLAFFRGMDGTVNEIRSKARNDEIRNVKFIDMGSMKEKMKMIPPMAWKNKVSIEMGSKRRMMMMMIINKLSLKLRSNVKKITLIDVAAKLTYQEAANHVGILSLSKFSALFCCSISDLHALASAEVA
ncbi:hypothetical protein Tco_0632861 [Tanacetum coccineum]